MVASKIKYRAHESKVYFAHSPLPQLLREMTDANTMLTSKKKRPPRKGSDESRDFSWEGETYDA